MKEFELSKYDFEALDASLTVMIKECDISGVDCSRVQKLKDKFAKAHTAILFIEEE